MMYSNLGISIACSRKLVEDLRVNHGPASLQLMLTEKLGGIEFECTIHIAHIDTQDYAHQNFPAPGVDLAHPGILSTHTIAQYSIILFKQRKELLQIMDVKLPIRVHEESQVFGHRSEATNQRS